MTPLNHNRYILSRRGCAFCFVWVMLFKCNAFADVSYLTEGGGDLKLIAPRNITTDTEGNCYVIDIQGVHKFDRSGHHTGMIGKDLGYQFNPASARGIAVAQKKLWVLDSRGLACAYDVAGRPVLGTGCQPGLFFDNLGSLYSEDPKTLEIVSNKGISFQKQLNEMPDCIVDPTAAVRAKNGRYYLADGVGRRVLIFGPEGRHIDRLKFQFQNPTALAIAGRFLFILDALSTAIDSKFIKVLNERDELIAEFGQPGAANWSDGRMDTPTSVAANDEFLFIADPAQNRVIRIAVDVFESARKQPWITFHQLHKETARMSKHQYVVKVDGSLGPANTARVEGTGYGATRTPRFQPNVSIVIENSGSVAVKNPRILLKGAPNWFSGAELAKEITENCQTDEEKAFACWDYVRRNMLPGVSWPDYFETPVAERSVVRFFNAFGSGACGSYHWLLPRVAMLAGLKAASGHLSDGSHGVAQIEYGGTGHYFDSLISHNRDPRTPIGLFFRKLDNHTVASYDDLVHDHYLMKRAGKDVGWLAREFGYHDGWDSLKIDYEDRYDMGILLRPGESFTRRWAYLGQYVGSEEPFDACCNGEIMYRPLLRNGTYRSHVEHEESMVCTADDGKSPALHAGRNNGRDCVTVFKVSSPYPIVGGTISGLFKRTGENDQLGIAVSYDRKTWFPVWKMARLGIHEERFGFGHLERLRKYPLHYEIYVRIKMSTTGPLDWVGVDDLNIEARFQAYEPSLPALDLGTNEITYMDETPEPHEIRIEHRWKTSSAITPPQRVSSPVFPPNGSKHHGYDFTFNWHPALKGSGNIVDYQFLLSNRPDMSWSLAPNFETFVGSSSTEFRVPEPSYFSPGGKYYWKVRPIDAHGVTGPWSDVWNFQVNGPGRPLRLKKISDGNSIRISWEQNPDGTRPVQYAIYGSDERGFTPSDNPYAGQDLEPDLEGQYPSLPRNLLADTTNTTIVVVSENNTNACANRAYYRVCAIDSNGVRSTPSEYIEVDHPFIFSSPITNVNTGKAYVYQIKTTWSKGHAGWSLRKGMSFLHEEELRFELIEAPSWLAIDRAKGTIEGIPPNDIVGPYAVRVRVTAYDTSRDEGPRVQGQVEQSFNLQVAKAKH
jgi:hypothetical protein